MRWRSLASAKWNGRHASAAYVSHSWWSIWRVIRVVLGLMIYTSSAIAWAHISRGSLRTIWSRTKVNWVALPLWIRPFSSTRARITHVTWTRAMRISSMCFTLALVYWVSGIRAVMRTFTWTAARGSRRVWVQRRYFVGFNVSACIGVYLFVDLYFYLRNLSLRSYEGDAVLHWVHNLVKWFLRGSLSESLHLSDRLVWA